MIPVGVTNIGDFAFGDYDPYGYFFSFLPSCVNRRTSFFPAVLLPSEQKVSALFGESANQFPF